jgi:hypothetical protein
VQAAPKTSTIAKVKVEATEKENQQSKNKIKLNFKEASKAAKIEIDHDRKSSGHSMITSL